MPDRMQETPPAARAAGVRAALAALAAVAVGGGLWTLVVFALPEEGRVLAALAAAVSVVLSAVAVFIAVHHATDAVGREDETERAHRATRAAAEHSDAKNAALTALLNETLPDAVTRLREGATADTVLQETDPPAEESHRRILNLLVQEIAVGERRRAAATAACANAAGRVQALSTRTLADLRDIENRVSQDMLGDILKIDHSTSQAGRIADSIAVLTGARSGRRWTKPIRMESILRGAMGRISAYRRVRVHSTSRSAVAGYAAEDVMHALAELMDNGAKFSAPSEEVHVYVEDSNNGAVISVEDGGLGMKPQALNRAELAVARDQPLDMTKLSGTRLGLAVVGCLARKHRLNVFFRPSSRGGIGVVLRIPNHLISQEADPTAPAVSAPARRGRRAATPPAPAPAVAVETTTPAPPPAAASVDLLEPPMDAPPSDTAPENAPETPRRDLPRRPRGETLQSAPEAPKAPASPDSAAERPRTDLGSRFGAFQAGRGRRGADSGTQSPAPPPAPDGTDGD